MKICIKCKKEKSLSEFYKHSQMKDRYRNKCKKCTRKDVRQYRENNIEKIRECDRKRSKLPHRMKLKTEFTQRLRAQFPDRFKAYKMIENALKYGKIIKPEICQVCNKQGRQIEGHHDNYSKPLEVIWLCSACHKQLHRDRKSI